MKFGIILQLVRRGISERYKGSFLGAFWTFFTPLLMLFVYTFVFGTVFESRWGNTNNSTTEFAIVLFAGLSLYQLFSDIISQAPKLITNNRVFVTKVQFSLQILPIVSVLTSLFHFLISIGLLLIAIVLSQGSLHVTILTLPLVLIPSLIMLLGISFALSFIGVFFRDVNQLIGPLLTAMMFLSPIFFPISALPNWIKNYIYINPLAFPVEQLRELVIFGKLPNFQYLGAYALISVLVACIGYWGFQLTRKGFADVL